MVTPARSKPTSEAASVALLPVQRQQMIIEFLHRHGAVTLQQLEQALRVSMSTLRRDLDALAEQGTVDRTHGGALLRQLNYSTFEPDHIAAAELSPVEKRLIGQHAADALQPQQSVIFDSGSTVLEAARAAAQRNIALTAVTNDLAIAQVLGSASQIRVHVLGGTLRPGSNTLLGDSLIQSAANIGVDVLLLGAHAVTAGELTETTAEVAAVKHAWLKVARIKRLLVDSSKFRPRAFMRVASVTDLDEVITDAGIAREQMQSLRKSGVGLSIVGAE
jgi:DeoR family transcriptional regulator of aga operon